MDLSYSFAQFEADVQKIKPRFFDTYILPGFMLWYAVASKREMKKNTRRILFSAGIYMAYRNYAIYKKAFTTLSQKLNEAQAAAQNQEATV